MPQPSFDNWTVVFLFFAMLAFLLGLFFIIRIVPAKKANRLLGIYIILFGVAMVEYVLYWTGYIERFGFMKGISICSPFVFGPLLLLYLKTVFDNAETAAKESRHFIPFIVLFVFSTLINRSNTVFNFLGGVRFYHAYFLILVWVSLVHMAGYGMAMLWLIKRQGGAAAVKKWAYWMVGFFWLLLAGHLTYYILSRFPFFNVAWDYFISGIMAAAVLCTAWFGFAHPAIFQGYPMGQSISSPPLVLQSEQAMALAHQAKPPTADQERPAARYKNSGLTPDLAKKIAAKLAALMEKDKVYRENDISLDKLAALLHVSRHQLSQVINEQYQVNFFEYINTLRIEEAKQMLTEKTKQELNAIEVAYWVGFNNKVSFTNAFKKATGLTPARYRQQKG